MSLAEVRQPARHDLVGARFTVAGVAASTDGEGLRWRVLDDQDGTVLGEGRLEPSGQEDAITDFTVQLALDLRGRAVVPVRLQVLEGKPKEQGHAALLHEVPLSMLPELTGWAYHRVQAGDTLSRIARTQAAGLRARDLYLANRDQLEDPDHIIPGQLLRIPWADEVTPRPLPALAAQLTGPSALAPGEEAEFSFTLANVGEKLLGDVHVELYVPPGLALVRSDHTDLQRDGAMRTAAVPELPPRGRHVVTLRLRMPDEPGVAQVLMAAVVPSATVRVTASLVTQVGSIRDAVHVLASSLEGATTATARIDVIISILGLAGLPVSDIAASVVATSPTAPARMLPGDAVALALASPALMTVAQLAQMLSQAGWPFLAGTPVETQFSTFLQGWIRQARETAGEPISVGPLLVAELASRRVPPIDLTISDLDLTEVTLSALDVTLLMSAWQRAVPPVGGTDVMSGALDQRSSSLLENPPQDCSQMLESWLGKIAGPLAEEATKYLGGKGIDKLLGDRAEDVGKALQAADLIAKVAKLALRYVAVETRVETSPQLLHKPIAGNGRRYATVTLTAGISEGEWQSYQQRWQRLTGSGESALRNCLALNNIPVMPDLGDLAASIDQWKVMWRVVGGGEHVHIDIDAQVEEWLHRGQLEMRVKRDGSHSARARLLVDVQQESIEQHNAGVLTTTPVTVRAEVRTHVLPGLGTWIAPVLNPLAGGISASADIISGWVEAMVPTTAFGTFVVEHHTRPMRYQLVGELVRRETRSSRWTQDPGAGPEEIQRQGAYHDELSVRVHLQSSGEGSWHSGSGDWAYSAVETLVTTSDGYRAEIKWEGQGSGSLTTGEQDNKNYINLSSFKPLHTFGQADQPVLTVSRLGPVHYTRSTDARWDDQHEQNTSTTSSSLLAQRLKGRVSVDSNSGQRVLDFNSESTERKDLPNGGYETTTVSVSGVLTLHVRE